MTRQSLLPSNSTPFEQALSQTLDRSPELNVEVDKIKWVNLSKNPKILPYLIYELGLSKVTQFIPSLLNIIPIGIAWQRVRGTSAAVRRGLQWIDYTAALEEAPKYRRKWHWTQLRFTILPRADRPDLTNIDGVVTLSLPERSRFNRGVYNHDVPAAEANATRLDGSILDFDSGIRIVGSDVIWSFGRSVEFIHDLTPAEGDLIGNWLPVISTGVIWTTANYPWKTANFPWSDAAEDGRKSLMAQWFQARAIHIVLRDATGAIIGYRRCRVVRAVKVAGQGQYKVANTNYAVSPTGGLVYIEAMTGFGDADGIEATSVSLHFHATIVGGGKPGQLWLQRTQVGDGVEIASKAISINLRRTVRDQFKFLLRF